MKTRRERTQEFYQQIHNEWSNHYWNFISQFENSINCKIICKNQNFTWQMIQKNLQNPNLNWNSISMNPNITEEIVRSHQNLPWCWTGLSLNPNITWNLVKENLEKHWNWT